MASTARTPITTMANVKMALTLLAVIWSFSWVVLPDPSFAASGGYELASAAGDARGKLNAIGSITGLGRVDVSTDAGLYEKIAAIINILLGFVGVVAVIFILYAGFKWITAGGNEEQITEARGNIRNAVIGIVVVFLAFVITNFVTKSLIDVISS